MVERIIYWVLRDEDKMVGRGRRASPLGGLPSLFLVATLVRFGAAGIYDSGSDGFGVGVGTGEGQTYRGPADLPERNMASRRTGMNFQSLGVQTATVQHQATSGDGDAASEQAAKAAAEKKAAAAQAVRPV